MYAKKPFVSVTYENERISIKISLPYLKFVLRLSCVVYGPIYGRFMGCLVTGLLYTYHLIQRKPYITTQSAHEPHRRYVTHILCKVSCFFLLKSFHVRRLVTETMGFFPNPYISNVTQYLELGLPVMRDF